MASTDSSKQVFRFGIKAIVWASGLYIVFSGIIAFLGIYYWSGQPGTAFFGVLVSCIISIISTCTAISVALYGVYKAVSNFTSGQDKPGTGKSLFKRVRRLIVSYTFIYALGTVLGTIVAVITSGTPFKSEIASQMIIVFGIVGYAGTFAFFYVLNKSILPIHSSLILVGIRVSPPRSMSVSAKLALGGASLLVPPGFYYFFMSALLGVSFGTPFSFAIVYLLPIGLAAIIALYFIGSLFTVPLVKATDLFSAAVSGKTTEPIAYPYNDEIGRLVYVYTGLTDAIAKATISNKIIASELSELSDKLLSTAVEQAAAASEQASAVTQTSATIAEISQTAQTTTDNTSDIKEKAHDSARTLNIESERINDVMGNMESLNDDVIALWSAAEELSEQARRVDDIILLVKDLAEQSAVLALNATIEAAKAGEAGRGFTAVAREVKSLATSSNDATRGVHRRLRKITSLVDDVSRRVRSEMKQSVDVLSHIQLTRDELIEIDTNVSQVAAMADQISAGMEQQAQGFDQISISIEQISMSAFDNVEGIARIEEIGSKTKELCNQLTSDVSGAEDTE